jgi:hypothetical protein
MTTRVDASNLILSTTRVAGQEVNFHRPSIGQLSEIIPLIAPFLSELLQGETSPDLATLLHRGDDLSRAISMATGTPEAWVMALQVDDFLVLLNTLLVTYTGFLHKLAIPLPDQPRGAVLRMAARSDGGTALPPAQTANSEG